jgi:hypothetical protein
VQHLAESFASLVAKVESLAELCATGSVHGANVLNICVNSRTERCALRKRRDTAGCWDLHDAQDVYNDQLDTDGKEHGWRRHGQDSDGWVVGAGATVVC